jgi:sugar/nucleoside kinase (ribokinase family)
LIEARKFDIVVVGELNPDLILSGNIIPEFGQVEKLINSAVLAIGSSSAIFACGAARLGLSVAFIGRVGTDLFGKYMCQSLDEYGIDICGIVEDKETPTGISIILSSGNDRAILTYPGTIPRLEFSDINQEIVQHARHLHVGSYFIQQSLWSSLPMLFDLAHEWGLSISLDTNYDPSGMWDDGLDLLLRKADIFLPNVVECQEIAGDADLERALDYLQGRVKCLGIKLGKDGALLFLGSKKYKTEPIKVAVIDTIGAGDSFDAGFIYGYLSGWAPERIIKFANICGGLSTRMPGGTAAQPSLEEALSYL